MFNLCTKTALCFKNYCRVASPAAIWGEWIACGPLLIFVVVTLDNKPRLGRMDWVLMGSFFLCMVAGFFIIIPSSEALGIFWLVVSFMAYLPSIFSTLLLPSQQHRAYRSSNRRRSGSRAVQLHAKYSKSKIPARLDAIDHPSVLHR